MELAIVVKQRDRVSSTSETRRFDSLISDIRMFRLCEMARQGQADSGHSKLDPFLRANAGLERMFDLSHLGYQISGVKQLLRRIAAGNDDM